MRSCGVLRLFLPIKEKARGLPVFGASCFPCRILSNWSGCGCPAIWNSGITIRCLLRQCRRLCLFRKRPLLVRFNGFGYSPCPLNNNAGCGVCSALPCVRLHVSSANLPAITHYRLSVQPLQLLCVHALPGVPLRLLARPCGITPGAALRSWC